VAWSPDGGAIAFVDGGSDGASSALYVASTDVLPLDPVVLIRPSLSGARQIADILWVGGNAGIVFNQRAAGDDLSIGGDLFAVSPFGGQPRLIAAAGGASQVGVVGEFAVSADGSTVAYTVLGVVDGRPGFASLWLRQVDGPGEVQVVTGQWQSVGSLEWTSAGLTWLGQNADGFAIERLQPDGSVTALFAAGGAATPVATPSASPVASPVATPAS
jgi:hypothetical protein